METINPSKAGWHLAGMVGFPILTLTAYLLWVWPRPSGTSLFAEAGPYFLSLLTGLPAVLRLTHGPFRTVLILAFFVVGFVVFWVYAAVVLCGVRNVCL